MSKATKDWMNKAIKKMLSRAGRGLDAIADELSLGELRSVRAMCLSLASRVDEIMVQRSLDEIEHGKTESPKDNQDRQRSD